MNNRWGKEFVPQQRNLEEIEKRNLIIGEGKLSEKNVAECLAADNGWKRPSRLDIWADRALVLFITYVDWMAFFLCGFLFGYILSALR